MSYTTHIRFGRLACGFISILNASCGGNVGYDASEMGGSGNSNPQQTGGASTASGGATSSSNPQQTGGAPAWSTVDLSTTCNGAFNTQNWPVCGFWQMAISNQLALTCDVPLPSVPTNPSGLVVAIDCTFVQLVPNNDPDGGALAGFAIDYSQTPPHLLLVGSSCSSLQLPATHQLNVIFSCSITN